MLNTRNIYEVHCTNEDKELIQYVKTLEDFSALTIEAYSFDRNEEISWVRVGEYNSYLSQEDEGIVADHATCLKVPIYWSFESGFFIKFLGIANRQDIEKTYAINSPINLVTMVLGIKESVWDLDPTMSQDLKERLALRITSELLGACEQNLRGNREKLDLLRVVRDGILPSEVTLDLASPYAGELLAFHLTVKHKIKIKNNIPSGLYDAMELEYVDNQLAISNSENTTVKIAVNPFLIGVITQTFLQGAIEVASLPAITTVDITDPYADELLNFYLIAKRKVKIKSSTLQDMWDTVELSRTDDQIEILIIDKTIKIPTVDYSLAGILTQAFEECFMRFEWWGFLTNAEESKENAQNNELRMVSEFIKGLPIENHSLTARACRALADLLGMSLTKDEQEDIYIDTAKPQEILAICVKEQLHDKPKQYHLNPGDMNIVRSVLHTSEVVQTFVRALNAPENPAVETPQENPVAEMSQDTLPVLGQESVEESI